MTPIARLAFCHGVVVGIDRDGARFLLRARSQGVDFSRTLTLGRMGLHLTVAELARALSGFGIHKSAPEMASLFSEHDGYAERFFKLLGAVEIESMDASAFEGATLVCDLNFPVPTTWHGRYSVVFDGGTLEHVFNYPTALRSCLEMVAVGGHFLSLTPANNYMGHGFYQFSPELYARVFDESNGFSLERMILFEVGADAWYEVIDPAKAGHRVSLVNKKPTMMAILARRTRQTEIFARPPQQSDYSQEWSEYTGEARPCRESARAQKSFLRRWLRRMKKWFKPRFPAKFFKRVDE